MAPPPRIAFLFAVLLSCAGCKAGYTDVGPNVGDGKRSAGPSSAGLTYQLAGDSNTMYAVSLDAGIWRRRKGSTWQELPQSSRLATSIAVDPSNPNHLVTGDRNNDASEVQTSQFDLSLSGIRESFDAGDIWQLSFSPLVWLANPTGHSYCNTISSQAVPVVIFTPSSTILAGTSCGVARKKTTEQTFDFTATPPDIDLVTAITFARKDVSTTVIWALARRHSNQTFVLMSSPDEGVSWTVTNLPPNPVNGFTIPQTDGEPLSSTGDFHSLLAFGDSVAIIFKPNPDAGNQTGLLYFNRATGAFSTQLLGPDARNGTGGGNLGGRRSLRTLYISPPFAVGMGMRAFVNTAQDIIEATGLDKNGQITWKHRVRTDCGSGCQNTDPVHVDIWDILPAPDSSEFWFACDGGVYSMTDQPAMFNDGLFTQHIHGLAIIDPGKLGSLYGPRLDYATSDNDAWFRYGAPGWTPSSGWHSYNLLGDANWVESDRGNSALSLEVRDTLDADLPDFGSAPSGTHNVGKKLVQIACTQGFNGKGDPICVPTGDTPRTWKIIQTGPALKAKTNAYLDTIWLAKLPLQYKSGDRVVEVASGPLANQIKNVSGSPVLLRNNAFAIQPDINSSKFDGWFLENGQVPAGTTRIWVSLPNGTQPFFPTYYAAHARVHRLSYLRQPVKINRGRSFP